MSLSLLTHWAQRVASGAHLAAGFKTIKDNLLQQVLLLFQEVTHYLTLPIHYNAQEMALVLTSLGKIRGRRTKTRDGRSIYSFRAVPYARPPVGYLRFARPEPALPWTGTLDCANRGESPSCLQVNVLSPESKFYLGVEDCLYLNVFTPHLPGAGRSALISCHRILSWWVCKSN